MKQKDIALIIIVTFVSLILAIFASKFLLSSTGGSEQEAETVDSISATFNSPDSKYYNDQSVNPTQIIRISDSKNDQLFDSATSASSQ